MALHSIPPHLPFLETLADEILAPREALADALILLPSRRNCRALTQVLVERSTEQALLLPRIAPLGEVDEDALTLELALGGDMIEFLPAISRMERIARLAAMFGDALPQHHSIMLARSLGELMDEFERAQVPLSALETLVPELYAQHWQKVIDVLKIAIRQWPRELEKLEKQNPIARRNQLVAALIKHWREHPPAYPIIAAGSTASTRATADLLAAIAELPNGKVVLPGLANVSEDYWNAVDLAHPYYFLKRFLENLPRLRGRATKLTPLGVSVVGGGTLSTPLEKGFPPESPRKRGELFLSAFAPPEMIPQWQHEEIDLASATEGLTLLEVENEFEEARTVALAAREALEDPNAKVMIVTESRDHAALISSALKRHGIEADASHGLNLLQTEVVTFLRLVLACAEETSAVNLLALLKHPLARAGLTRAECLQAAREMDVQLRGYALLDVFHALEHEELSDAARAVVATLKVAITPLARALKHPHIAVTELIRLHISVAEQLAEDLWKGEQGQAVAEVLAELATSLAPMGAVQGALYSKIFEELLAQEYYQAPYGTHPRLSILSSQEARLLSADLVIVAGMVEGQMPPAAIPNPWMGRHMMEALGLHLPETAASRTAHDMLMLSHAKRLVLSRPRHVGGNPAEPSRYITRLTLYLKSKDEGFYASLQNTRIPALLKQLDAAALNSVAQPAPTPPTAVRPRRFTVSEIETLLRDPYAIYAKHILKLKPLEVLQRAPDAALFGKVMHKVLERFSTMVPDTEQFRAVGVEVMRTMLHQTATIALWQPRMDALMEELVALERARRVDITSLKAETSLAKTFAIGDLQIELRTRIDRLEEHRDGGQVLTDYKTGAVLEASRVKSGKAPQLPLMAMIVEGVSGKPVTELEYWNVSGRAGLEPSTTPYTPELRAKAEAGFKQLMEVFLQVDTPYIATRDDEWNDYAHLERTAEWV